MKKTLFSITAMIFSCAHFFAMGTGAQLNANPKIHFGNDSSFAAGASAGISIAPISMDICEDVAPQPVSTDTVMISASKRAYNFFCFIGFPPLKIPADTILRFGAAC